MSEQLLQIAWFFMLGFFLALYVMLDGFDLGVGILSLFARKNERKSVMMTSLSTVWDANEVWLVIWGGALFGAFPLAYATVLNALYIPVMIMLFALVFRGVSFEFQGRESTSNNWDLVFGAGSFCAALAQGMILGGVLSGIHTNSFGIFTGGTSDWAQLITLVVIIEVLSGYIMLGSAYLVMKTVGSVQHKNRRVAIVAAITSLGFAITTAFVIPHLNKSLAGKLLLYGHREGLSGIFLSSAICFIMLLYSIVKKHDRAVFIWSELVFLLTFGGLWFAVYPWLLPGAVTISMAASSKETLMFMLVGIGPVVPVVLTYNIYVYRVFRGKINV